MPVQPQRGLRRIETYVPGKPIEEVQREYGLEDVVKLASNENPLGPSPKAAAAIAAALPNLNRYPDGQSYYLRRALAARLGLDMEYITVGNGADGLIMQTCMAYLDEGDVAVVSRSSFPVYDIYVHAMRGTLVKTPLRDFRLDLPAMAHRAAQGAKLVFVCNPNNPTGTIVTADEVEEFMAQVPDEVLVVFDEAYHEFVDAPDYPDGLGYVREGRPNVLVLRTLSKVYGLAGVRLGYAVGRPEVIAPLRKIKEPFAVNYLAQVAGVAALDDEEFLRRYVALNRQEREYLYGEFARLGLRYVPSHTNFILVEVGSQAAEVQERLLAQGVIVRPCGGYDLPDFLRVSVGSHAQNARFITALERVLTGTDG